VPAKNSSTYGKEKDMHTSTVTGDAASILYAEDKFDITKEIIKALNEIQSTCKPEEK
jgi:outer membrane protein